MLKKILYIIAIIISIMAIIFYDFYQNPKEITKKKVENFSIESLFAKKIFFLNDIKEETIILSFWASWCAPCKKELPILLSLIKEKKGKIALVTISIDENKKNAKKLLKRLNINIEKNIAHSYWGFDQDKKISLELFNISQIPKIIILDKNRFIIKKTIEDLNSL